MTSAMARRFAYGALVLYLVCAAAPLRAQYIVGTWVKQARTPAEALTMTVEPCCNGGVRLVYRTNGSRDVLMTVDTPLNGADAPMLGPGGQPTGGTMAITRIDPFHAVAVLKMKGAPYGKSTATLSPDSKTLTVENDVTTPVPGALSGKQTEIWVKQ